MKKHIILTSLIAIATCTLVASGTYAWFSSQATSSNNLFVAGTLKIGGIIDGKDIAEKFARINVDNINPGQELSLGTTQLKNVGTLPYKTYRVTASNFSGTGWDKLDDYLNLTVKIGDKEVYTGTFSQLQAGNGGYFDPIYNIPVGDVRDMKLIVSMKPEADNDCQNKSITCDLSVYATQNEVLNQGEPIGSVVNLGRASGAGTISDPSFTVTGIDKGNEIWFDWSWIPEDNGYENYQLNIKHHTGNPTMEIEEIRLKINKKTQTIETVDGIKPSQVSVDWDGDIVKIKKSAFPITWKGFEVELSGTRTNGAQLQTIPYQYWSLNRP